MSLLDQPCVVALRTRYVQVAISACQSAMRGGLICSRALLRFANKQRWIDVREEDTKLDEVVGYSLAVLGFYTQFRCGGGHLGARRLAALVASDGAHPLQHGPTTS